MGEVVRITPQDLAPNLGAEALKGLDTKTKNAFVAVALATEAGHLKDEHARAYIQKKFSLDIPVYRISQIKRSPLFAELIQEATSRYVAEARLLVAKGLHNAASLLLDRIESGSVELGSKDIIGLLKALGPDTRGMLAIRDKVESGADGEKEARTIEVLMER